MFRWASNKLNAPGQRSLIQRSFAKGVTKPAAGSVAKISGKAAALEMALSQITRSHGKGALMRLDSRADLDDLVVTSTGSLGLDIALGVGGIPAGRITEIYGPEASGKTTLALHVIAEAQKRGGSCAFIDAEHALDGDYAARVGVAHDQLYVAQPDSGEQALDIVDTLVRSGAVDVIVVDSVAALTPRAEIQGDVGDHHIALQARLMGHALRKITGSVSKTGTTLIFINQLRSKVGVIFGSPEVTSGGNALKFYSSVRLEIRRTGSVKQGDEILGNAVRVKVAKNKLAPPFKQCHFDIEFGHGISKLGETIDHGVGAGVLTKAGAWIHYGDVSLGQGREKAKDYLRENPTVTQEIDDAIRNHSLPDDARGASETPNLQVDDAAGNADAAAPVTDDPITAEELASSSSA
jgi:recombination protein RecA